jgi:hypothetical protein
MRINRQQPSKTQLLEMDHTELAAVLLTTMARVRELETAITEALEPGRWGWEFLEAEDMADRLVETYDPFDQAEPDKSPDPYQRMAQSERAALAAWNAGEPIKAMTPAGYYVVTPR